MSWDTKDYGDDIEYGLSGSHFVCRKPLRLNDLPGFKHFYKKTMGCFAYGFQNAINDPFCKFLTDETLYTPLKEFNMSCLEWLADFEDGLDDELLCLTNRDKQDKPYWEFFLQFDDEKDAFYLLKRARTVLDSDVDFLAEEFKKQVRKNPEIKFLHIPLSNTALDLAKLLPETTIKIVCGDYHESWNDFIELLSKQQNVVLMRNFNEPWKI